VPLPISPVLFSPPPLQRLQLELLSCPSSLQLQVLHPLRLPACHQQLSGHPLRLLLWGGPVGCHKMEVQNLTVVLGINRLLCPGC
jgi:hypothetical protein